MKSRSDRPDIIGATKGVKSNHRLDIGPFELIEEAWKPFLGVVNELS